MKIQTDIIIIGAGIAGLWLHHRLNDLGYHAVLIEKNSVGSQQTLSSQGIIHGGAKYTLNGIFSNAASAIADMPQRWLECIQGNGEIDLTDTQVLSNNQLMWSTQGLSSKLTSFFSSKALNGKILPLKKEDHPEFFQTKAFKGNLYQLNEPVLDIPSLIKNLSKKWNHRIVQASEEMAFSFNNQELEKIIIGQHLTISAKEFIFTSGEGTEQLLKDLSLSTPRMQRRPLQMVLAKGDLPALYAHCIGASTKPIATITTHSHSDGDNVWYIGGNIAENGVNDNKDTLIQQTKDTLKKVLPWVDLENIQWETHRVNRAEPSQKDKARPDTAFLQTHNNIHIGWPTKLALTPNLADQAIQQLSDKNIKSSSPEIQNESDQQLKSLDSSFSAKISDNLWERAFNAKS